MVKGREGRGEGKLRKEGLPLGLHTGSPWELSGLCCSGPSQINRIKKSFQGGSHEPKFWRNAPHGIQMHRKAEQVLTQTTCCIPYYEVKHPGKANGERQDIR